MSNRDIEPNGWNTWGKHVLTELTRLNDCYERQAEQMIKMRESIVMLKTKAGAWGAVGGAVGGALLAIIVSLILARL